MAITYPEYKAYEFVSEYVPFPERPDILEFGEATVLGISPQMLVEWCAGRLTRFSDAEIAAFAALPPEDETTGFALAKMFYQALFGYRSYTSIDLHGTQTSLCIDLNKPFDLKQQFDVCINNGTSEHIFNQYQFFLSMHEHTRLNGLMIHLTPTFGWYDHGLFHPQPGMFQDLAAANGYKEEMILIFSRRNLVKIGSVNDFYGMVDSLGDMQHANIMVVLRKMADRPFVVPMQGYYASGRDRIDPVDG